MKKSGICVNCGKMGQLFHDLCTECYDEEMYMVKEIRGFLKKHPKSNAMDISSETGISITKVTRLIKNGTLI
ncbi:helix-turn-helix domain-containing protein [Oceanobacillus salinisoli]|uniref:hypothetical protein n=1 Tax=Oceanobacillus salinisoli TaxID=2678611 RepID=UPI0012E0FB4C|nr:hypothetical protein [Oceanobacillus salinisoli]